MVIEATDPNSLSFFLKICFVINTKLMLKKLLDVMRVHQQAMKNLERILLKHRRDKPLAM